jgi:signal transduction histidine kinase
LRERLAIFCVGVFFAAGAVGAFGLDAYTSRQDRIAAAERETRNIASLLAEQMRQFIATTDQTLKAAMVVRDEWLADAYRTSVSGHRMLRSVEVRSDFVDRVVWTDARGDIQAASDLEAFGERNIADREHFRFHAERPGGSLYISAPFVARRDGQWSAAVTRRIETRDDAFQGVVSAVLDLTYLERVLERYHATGVHLSLFLRDGRYFARYPEPERRIGQTRAGGYLFTERLPKASSGTFHAPATSDGHLRIYSYQTVQHYGLVVSVSMPKSVALAPWFSRIGITGSVTGLALIGSIFATWFIGRQARRLARQERIAHEARLVAEHASRSKSEFLAHMSHELRTPMNAVIGFTEMMTKEIFGPVGSPKYREYLGDIAVSGQHLLHVVNNILDLAKVEAGKWQMEEEEIDLRELCESTIQMVRERARSAAVSVVTDPASPATRIRADRRLMRQIVVNLLTNGIKFTERGGTVSLGWHALADGGIELTVADTGVGMTEEDCRRVLQPFGRGSAELARARHDTGLGLSLCKQFTEMHGGRLGLSSRPGQGTTVSVTLPAARVVSLGTHAAAA